MSVKMKIVEKLMRAFAMRVMSEGLWGRVLDDCQRLENDGAAEAPLVLVVNKGNLKVPGTFGYVPVVAHDGSIALRAVVLVRKHKHQGAILAHEMAHFEQGAPNRLLLSRCWDVPGDLRLYGLSPNATARVEEETNLIAITKMNEDGAPEIDKAILVACQETYWFVEGAWGLVKSPRHLMRQVLLHSRPGDTFMGASIKAARLYAQNKGVNMAVRNGVSFQELMHARGIVARMARSK